MTKQKTIDGLSELPEWVNSSTWQAYLVQRKTKKAANTAYALEKILVKLDGFRQRGHDPNSVLDASIEHGWTGVFEPKGPLGVVAGQQTYRERDQAQRQNRADRWTGKAPADNVIDMEVPRAARIGQR